MVAVGCSRSGSQPPPDGGAAGSDAAAGTTDAAPDASGGAIGACPGGHGDLCARVGQTCTRGDVCCACQINGACSPEPRWYCVVPADRRSECQATPPIPMGACPIPNLRCSYCIAGQPQVLTCARASANGREQWNQDAFIVICR
jgi:hypothetical protein